jgi:hypothetical protein
MKLGLSLNLTNFKARVSGPTTTFDPTYGGLYLSNNNLTVSDSGGQYPVARSSTTKSSGKYYVEIASPSSVHNFVGIALPSVPFSISASYVTNVGITVLQTNGLGWRDGASTSSGIAALSGANYYLGLAIDLDNRKLWIKNATSDWNGIPTDNPATNTGGFAFGSNIGVGASVHCIVSANGNNPLTVNFGASAFQMSPPSGFQNWT